jgi:hypothetical protein
MDFITVNLLKARVKLLNPARYDDLIVFLLGKEAWDEDHPDHPHPLPSEESIKYYWLAP